ncbi:MAG: class I SAM-dependent methyltransferase [Burkholderiaceae bacterium]|nr:class I SAM-dependent methyltransferase [Burkholderiaceae bacterium]
MTSHDDQVNRQFGPAASAYLTSTAHAQGADLDKLSRIVQGKSAEVLDLGCGAGHVSFAVAAGVNAVTACDLSDDMLAVVAAEAAKRGLGNIATRQGIAEALPFPDCSFDYVLTRFSAHHWNSLPQALAEMRRVLKDDGRVIVIDVVAPTAPLLDTHLQSIELLRDVSHVRNYSVAEWTRQLAAAGLQVDAGEQWKLPLEFQAWVTRIKTPQERVAVIRGLLQGAPQEVRDYLRLQADCSFSIDVAMFEASPLH